MRRVLFFMLVVVTMGARAEEYRAYLVKDIAPGSQAGSAPICLTDYKGTLLFAAKTSFETGYELWRSDGTAEGTSLVRELYPGSNNGFIGGIQVIGNKAYFSGYTPDQGIELWTTDGTAAGTNIFWDMSPGTNSSNTAHWMNVDGELWFTTPNTLWRSDLTIAGTRRVNSSFPTFKLKVVSGNRVYFLLDSGTEIYASDGTTAGTDLIFNGYQVHYLGALKGRLFFNYTDGNWPIMRANDGTMATTQAFKYIEPKGYSCEMDDRLYFFAYDITAKQNNLWKTDGSADGTVVVLPNVTLNAPNYPQVVCGTGGRMAVAGGVLYFSANDNTHGMELWRTDGTAAGTYMVQDIKPGFGASNPTLLTASGDELFFCVNGSEIWHSDGTAAGTGKVENPAPFGSINGLTACGGRVYFVSPSNSSADVELWAVEAVNAVRDWRDYP